VVSDGQARDPSIGASLCKVPPPSWVAAARDARYGATPVSRVLDIFAIIRGIQGYCETSIRAVAVSGSVFDGKKGMRRL